MSLTLVAPMEVLFMPVAGCTIFANTAKSISLLEKKDLILVDGERSYGDLKNIVETASLQGCEVSNGLKGLGHEITIRF
jgi:uncharacterized OsmC-like protein